MPQDATCPSCKHIFPVTEARQPFTVPCPRCETDLTVEFKKPAAAPEAGQPPFDLLVKKGTLPEANVPPPVEKRRKDEDDDEPKRKGGSAMVVLLSGGLGLLFVLGGLGLTGWFLFTQIDYETTSTYNTNTNRPNNSGNRPNNPGWNPGGGNPGGNPGGNNPGGGNNNPPPKPKDTFELRSVAGTLPLISPPADLDPSSPRTVLLPGKAGAVAVGGGGRYIVFHFPDQGRVSVFDANIGELLPDGLTMENGGASMTAGANKFVVTVPGNKLRVYSLPGLQKQNEFDVLPPFGARGIAMAPRANGPVLAVNPFGDMALMDLTTGKPIEGASGKFSNGLPSNHMRASADGKVFFATNGYGGNEKLKIVDEHQKKWRLVEFDLFAAYGGPDGKLMYGKDTILEVNGTQAKQVAGRPAGVSNPVWYVPAVTATGHYFLRVNEVQVPEGKRTKTAVSVAVHKDKKVDKPVLTAWEGLPETEGFISWGRDTEPLDRHLFLIPEAKLLVILNKDKTKLVVRKLQI